MSTKFEAEKWRVMLLIERLGSVVDEYRDPNADAGGETGADVVAVIGGYRIGIQVTDLDTGQSAGQARAAETRLARDAEKRGTTYGTWAQNDPQAIIQAIKRCIARKAQLSFAGFDKFWLLICYNVPLWGAIGSTFAMARWIDTAALNAATLSMLSNSSYDKAFIHAISFKEQALFEWSRGVTWSKSIVPVRTEEKVSDFWEYKNDPELLRDPKGWCEREVRQILAELRNKRN